MDLKMFSKPEPPATGSEVAFVIKKVCLKSQRGLVDLLVDICCPEKSKETTYDQINSYSDSQAHRVPGSALPRRQIKSPPSPYKLETCILANILPFEEKWSEKATIFLKSVLDKQMSGLVEDVLMPDRIILIDIPLISKFLSRGRLAKKIEAGPFKSLVLSSLDSPEGLPPTPCSSSPDPTKGGCAQKAPGQYLYLELQPDLFENVKVTQVTDPLSLFCKLSIFSKELKKLSNQMQLHYNESSAPSLDGPRVSGSPCATRDTDGTWHRSLLTQDVASGAGSVEVLHVDHGETQLIPTSDIRHLHENFLRIPVVTYHCAIDGVHATTWRQDQIHYLKSLLCNAVVARFERYDAIKNIYDVTLFGVEAECINAYFAEKSGVLSDPRHACKDSAADDRATPSGTDDVDKSFSTKVDLTNRFLQGSTSPKSENTPANRKTDDDKCIDKKWRPNPSPIRRENANSVVPNGHASPQFSGVEKNTILEQSLPVGSCDVDLKTPLQSVCNLLTQAMASQSVDPLEASPDPLATPGYSCSTHDLEVGSREKVCIMCSVSVDHFYCQLSRNGHSFDRIMEGVRQLLASQPQSADLPLVVDSACIARYNDNKWYRGQIKTTHPELQVYFVDFGDVMSLKRSDVCPVPAECSVVRSLPVQAIEIGLFNAPADVPKEINDWFEEHAVGQCFTISVVEKDSSGKLLVELFDGTLNVNLAVREKTMMVKNQTGPHPQSVPSPSSSTKQSTLEITVDHCKMQKQTITEPKVVQKMSGTSVSCASVGAGKDVNPSVEPRKPFQNATLADLPIRLVEQGLSSAVHISHFNNPSSFFVQLQQDENDIYAIVEKLNDPEGLFSGPVNFNCLNVEDLISAEFPDDGSWYRAVVGKKLDNETLTVQFIDFGNEATIPCVKTYYLDKEFLAQPRFSIPCTFGAMSDSQERWDQEMISAFKNATMENPEKTYSCTFMKETENVWDIVLEDHGIVLAQTLIQQTQTYTKPDIIPNSPYQAYASCIVGPHFFWCQHENAEVLDKVSKLVEEAGCSGEQDPTWVETLHPGSPCLALFTDDNQWHRAQVIRRTGDALSVVFIDYGNEAEVDGCGVKAVPHFLLEAAPQAFLCTLEGFDGSKGAWEQCAYDKFYELLVEKALCVTPLNRGDNLYMGIPQHAVKVAFGDTTVNTAMENYWKGSGEMDGDRSPAQSPIAPLCQESSDEHQHPTKLLTAFTEW